MGSIFSHYLVNIGANLSPIIGSLRNHYLRYFTRRTEWTVLLIVLLEGHKELRGNWGETHDYSRSDWSAFCLKLQWILLSILPVYFLHHDSDMMLTIVDNWNFPLFPMMINLYFLKLYCFHLQMIINIWFLIDYLRIEIHNFINNL